MDKEAIRAALAARRGLDPEPSMLSLNNHHLITYKTVQGQKTLCQVTQYPSCCGILVLHELRECDLPVLFVAGRIIQAYAAWERLGRLPKYSLQMVTTHTYHDQESPMYPMWEKVAQALDGQVIQRYLNPNSRNMNLVWSIEVQRKEWEDVLEAPLVGEVFTTPRSSETGIDDEDLDDEDDDESDSDDFHL